MQVKKQQLEPCMEQLTGSGLRKEYNKTVYCHLNLYTKHIMQDARLDELQTGIKIAGRNINNLKYANVITLMVKSEEEIQSLLMRVKKRVKKTGLKLNTQKTKIHAK